MQNNFSPARIDFQPQQHTIFLKGNWSLAGIASLPGQIHKIKWPSQQAITINGAEIQRLDSAGAWQIYRLKSLLEQHNNQIELSQFSSAHEKMFQLVVSKAQHITEPKKPATPSILYRVGKASYQKYFQIHGFVSMIGELFINFIDALQHWRRFHIPSIVTVIEHTGFRALPIIGLLSFLIGIVLAYQMGLQLETYGANIFIVYLTGMAILREFGPLIAAIIVAGRTSSSFTAQLGTMKVNEEIDALLTMGLSPVERLVLPKVIGLLIAFPLIIIWADIFGIMGSMIMSKFQLNIGYITYIHRIKETIAVSNYWIGMSKAPTFALIIAAVGSYQGFLVSSSADSVGIQTTKSVVQSLFLIIIADAAFSVFYSWLGL